MIKWNMIPNEILSNILKELPNKDLYHCLLVNNQWLTVAQTILYKEISIDIGFTDNIFDNLMLNTLVNSVFKPGRWVRKITIQRLKVPDNLFHLDPNTDPLHLLMTHCPLVEEFCFDRINFILETEWIYFSKVLEQSNSWQLRTLATYYGKEDYKHYYSCAHVMRDSLTQFQLKKKVKDGNYNAHFQDFKKLNSIDISRHVVKTIIDSEKILASLPHLANVEIDFHVPKSDEAAAKDKNDPPTTVSKRTYPKITELQLKNLPLSRNQELLFIMDKFPSLTDLKIKVAKGKPWPITKIAPDVMREFFRFVSKIPTYSVIFKDIDIVRVLLEYYAIKENIGQYENAIDISFNTLLDEGEKTTSLELYNMNGINERIKLRYNLVGSEAENRIIKAKRTLAGIGRFITEIHVSLSGKQEYMKPMETFLALVFDSSCRELRKLIVSGGRFSEEVPKKKLNQAGITYLQFNKAQLDTKSFMKLSSIFPYLETFCLNECTFVYNGAVPKDIRVNMPFTDFETISILNKKAGIFGIGGTTKKATEEDEEFGAKSIEIKRRGVVFITIEINNKNGTSRFYHGNSTNCNISKVKKSEYFNYLSFCRRNKEEVAAVLLRVKSIKTLFLHTPYQNIRLEI